MKTFSQLIFDISEAAGDPIKSAQVIPLDAEAQKNIRSAMTPAGPSYHSPEKSKKQKSSYVDRFIKRMIHNTSLSPQ